MRTCEEICALYQERYASITPIHQAALEVRTAYYGEITLPVPEIDRNERPLVANFLFSAGEQKAMRVASTMPGLFYPSTKPGVELQDKRAQQRRNVNLAWWDSERMSLKLRKRARYAVYYASSSAMITPNFKEHRPAWKTRNPIATFAPQMDDGDLCPEDVIFTYPQSFAWLMKKYPQAAAQFGDPSKQDGTVTILEYQDADDYVLIASGEKTNDPSYAHQPTVRVKVNVELERVPNRVGRCTAVVANGIGLDNARGTFDGTLGMWQAMGKLMALEAIGMQRAIWPEMWLTDDPNGDGANIITQADPLHGQIGHVTGGKFDIVHPLPEAMAGNMIDRLERYQRIDAGIPPELGGESGSNIRTGKRGDAILSAVLDFPMQEMQEILAMSLQEENRVAIAIDKAYFPTSKSIYLSATAGQITYEAEKLWETDTHFVKYSHAGVDAQGIVIELGQLVGTGLISKRSAMETHPLIEDPQAEFDRINHEHMRDGLLAGLGAMAQDPSMAPTVAQVLKSLRDSEMEVEDAVIAVHEALQQQQAAAAAQQQQEQQQMPGMPPGPGGQPGMAEPQPAIAQAPPSLTNLSGLLTALRKGPPAAVGSTLGMAQ